MGTQIGAAAPQSRAAQSNRTTPENTAQPQELKGQDPAIDRLDWANATCTPEGLRAPNPDPESYLRNLVVVQTPADLERLCSAEALACTRSEEGTIFIPTPGALRTLNEQQEPLVVEALRERLGVRAPGSPDLLFRRVFNHELAHLHSGGEYSAKVAENVALGVSPPPRDEILRAIVMSYGPFPAGRSLYEGLEGSTLGLADWRPGGRAALKQANEEQKAVDSVRSRVLQTGSAEELEALQKVEQHIAALRGPRGSEYDKDLVAGMQLGFRLDFRKRFADANGLKATDLPIIPEVEAPTANPSLGRGIAERYRRELPREASMFVRRLQLATFATQTRDTIRGWVTP